MRYPVNKVYITQKWGVDASTYARFGYKGHNGVDLRIFDEDGNKAISGNVYAPHSGYVIEAANDADGYGLYLKIENDQEGSILGHNKQLLVKVGDYVSEGQLIAYSDNTGWSTGAHVHWGYYRKPRNKANGYGGTIDPTPYIKPENKPIGGQMEIDKKLFEELVGKSTKYDEFVNAGFSDPKAVSEEIEKLKKSRKNLEKSLETTEKALADKALYVTDLESERETLKKQIRDLKEELEAPKGAVDPTHFANTLAVFKVQLDAISDQLSDLFSVLKQEKVLKAIQDQTKAIENLSKNISSTPTDQVPNKSLIRVIVDWLERKK